MTTHDQADDQDLTTVVADLQTEVTELRVALARAEAERDAARTVAIAEVAAKDVVIGELRAMLAEYRRPWWRRWMATK